MTPLPACCTPLDAHWPLPDPLPGTVLLSTRFDPALLIAGDFQRSAVPPPASIQRSVAKRQAEFLAGRLCARAALQQLDNLDCVPAIGEDRAPVWPPHISGSITHSSGHAAAIVGHKAQWRGLGMDLENVLSLERAERLAGEILTADELQRMARLPREQHAQLVTLTFSAKESLFKALYPIVQKRFYFEHAEVVEWSEHGQMRLRLLTELSGEWCHGKELVGQFAVDGEQLLSLVAIGV
ncbi:4'-phosphopantetheinyl transferase superfamily protein [Pseudomonas veronii]|jgi:enterobactin synthetase component D|uniref:Enterobactin synthase component D n=1 Tax=Pseudomonas veronii TaxID=76761 RepID=A0A7Y0ZXK1_PSEVE|nr:MULTISPECIES: 4'-phosphopantetheinyl transferase superfamily protein [Pseudomonas]SEB36473.1 enterobactin synthetase component D [Pseudomonas marginalis]KRP70093.1 4'-phosphopantetheinyl transferase [Pseudomonas veronii]NMX41290.1 4'-phosphopantetheinyl transferase superfamily protein [Pseudomonas veronii]NMX53229.1 4'-phosphopantetheinyl transferase superfamily protein [Pseudomonas veronii]NMX99899.1 4'-phosphopantetheinyl transferase superfamily protein [Pseudomonas veronii]